jgi:NADPH-dependent ferric siderophore reductase
MQDFIHRDKENFLRFKISDREKISDTADVFTFERYEPWHKRFLMGHTAELINAYHTGAWHMEFKQPQIQVVRAYTPLPVEAGSQLPKDGCFPLQFLVRREHNGEVSNWLHRLPIGAELMMRGPYIEYEVPEEPSRVIILAGGTGIATALQVATAALNDRKVSRTADDASPTTKWPKSESNQVHILWASRKREDCRGGTGDNDNAAAAMQRSQRIPHTRTAATDSDLRPPAHANSIVKRLEALQAKYPGRLTVSYYVDEEGTFINHNELQKSVRNWSAPSTPAVPGPSPDQSSPRTEIILSGPDGFIAALAGPKVWEHGRQSQGPLGGILSQVIANLSVEQKDMLGKIAVYKL